MKKKKKLKLAKFEIIFLKLDLWLQIMNNAKLWSAEELRTEAHVV